MGVNKYRLEKEEDIDVLAIDNTKVRESQEARIRQVKESRDTKKAEACLAALTESAKTGKGNLLELSVEAARARCTVGEITEALAIVWGRHEPETRVISGAYKSEYGENVEVEDTLRVVNVSVDTSVVGRDGM